MPMRLFKHYFIPHEGNDYQPHFLRKKAALVLACAALFVELVFLLAHTAFIAPRTHLLALVLPDALVDETNARRVENNLGTLKFNPLLHAAALAKANDMAAKSYFAHTSPEGYAPWHWLELAGYDFNYAGENLAIDFSDSKDVVNAWMFSPLHRENILNSHFSEIGIATAEGMYEGHPTTFVVQFFGQPVPRQVAVTIPVTVAAAPAKNPTALRPSVAHPATSTAPSIVKETMKSAPLRQELFATVEGVSTTEAAPIAPASQVSSRQSNIVETIIAAPRTATNRVFYLLGIVLAFALALTVFIKIRIQHPRLILNGLALIMLVAFFIAANHIIALSSARVF